MMQRQHQLYRCFDNISKPINYKAIIPNVDLNEKNIAMNEWQRRSEKFDLAKEDNNPDLEFNIVLWHAIKGDVPFPGPKRAAFIKPAQRKDVND
jgi:hypothetical protein